MSKTLETIQKIQRSARHMPEVRVIADMKLGQVVRQGDIYIERVAALEDKGNAVKSRQLAPGTSKGSRHIVSESEAVTLWETKPSLDGKAAFQIGAGIEAEGDVTVTHPEHAWIKIIGDKVKRFYQVWFQADFARKERAQD
jgi:hypothetical protein